MTELPSLPSGKPDRLRMRRLAPGLAEELLLDRGDNQVTRTFASSSAEELLLDGGEASAASAGGAAGGAAGGGAGGAASIAYAAGQAVEGESDAEGRGAAGPGCDGRGAVAEEGRVAEEEEARRRLLCAAAGRVLGLSGALRAGARFSESGGSSVLAFRLSYDLQKQGWHPLAES